MGCSESTEAVAKSPAAGAPANGGTANGGATSAAANATSRRQLRNVFAKPFEDDEMTDVPDLPVFTKSIEENSFLEKTLPEIFLFGHLNSGETKKLIDAMELIVAEKNEKIIQQGDTGDFFYVVYEGKVDYLVDGKVVGEGTKGDSFGELSLLYTSPRAATVQSTTPAKLFRVDQLVFRHILQQQAVDASAEKVIVLQKVAFLKELDEFALNKIADVMTLKHYAKDTVILKKGDTEASHCYILKKGSVLCADVEAGDAAYEDVVLKAKGDFFGERALVTGEPRAATVTALEDTSCFTIDRKTFETILGDFKSAILKSNEKRKLGAIKVIADSQLNSNSLTALTNFVEDKVIPAGTTICTDGETTVAALYFIHSGTVIITEGVSSRTVGPGGYFGDDQLKVDVGRQKVRVGVQAKATAKYTAKVAHEDVVSCGVLTLTSCRRVFDTRYMGSTHASSSSMMFDSIVDKGLHLDDLEIHKILGAGTFGQVWLVSRTQESNGNRIAYALKIQSKYELTRDGQAKSSVREKTIMASLQHPFLINLVNTYRDDKFVYMLLHLAQGGELYNLIYPSKSSDSLGEESARFYTACVVEALGFMHRRGYAYRDLKPENILIDNDGYCVVIDLGFAKFVPAPKKTFTLCGTPLYLAPEVIMNRGHNTAADHWGIGVLIYEMLTKETPFYRKNMDQISLYRSIVKGKFEIPWDMSDDVSEIITAFLCRDPSKRLGNLVGGEDDIPKHLFLAGIDFDQLRQKKLKPPMIPNVKSPLDCSHFDDWSAETDKRKKKFPKLTAEEDKVFDDF